ncbi:MAG: Y-family DNA polymerase [bacterium]|nr:Y-family DNA polymerase [bacterium]
MSSTPSANLLALVDCNNFYVACERVFNPALENRPVVVLSNNDGCIVARSPEVKALGIEMGIPAFQIRDHLLYNNVQIYSSNYTLYGDMSRRVVLALQKFVPAVETYSIDESFLELPNTSNPNDLAHTIRHRIRQWTGIPVSIGIGPTKSLAKLANKLAKHPEQGVFDLTHPPHRNQVMDEISVSEVWGIGPAYTQKLHAAGIETAYQLSRANDRWIQKHLTIVGLRIAWELRGIPCIPLELTPPPRKAICRSRSFGRPITRLSHLKQAVAFHAASAARVLREQGLVAACLQVTIETNPYVQPYNGKSITARLAAPTASTPNLIQCAHAGLKRIYSEGDVYTRAGILLTDLCPENAVQTSLFWNPDSPRTKALLSVVDHINIRFGRGKIHWASEGLEQPWAMRQSYRSHRFTTCWDELPLARASF